MSASRSASVAGSSTLSFGRASATPATAPRPATTTATSAALDVARNRHLIADLHGAIHVGIRLLEPPEIALGRRPVTERDVGLDELRQRVLVDAADGEAG